MSFDFTQTDAGIVAFATAVANNTAVTVQTAELGSGQYTPDGTETAITTPFAPAREFDPVRGSVSGEVLKFDFQDTTTDAYDVGEVGLFDAAGVLLFIGSRPAAEGYLFSKGADAVSGFSFEYTLATADMPTIDFAGAGYPVALADVLTYGIVRRVADDTPTTDAARYVTAAYMAAQIAAIDTGGSDASAITFVEPSRVVQVANEIRLTPDPAVTTLVEGQAFRFRVEAATNGGVSVKVNALVTRQLRRRGNVRFGNAAPQFAVGDLVTIVWVDPRFWLVSIQPGTAVFYDVGTADGTVPVLGSGGVLASGLIPNLPASQLTSGVLATARLAAGGTVDQVLKRTATGHGWGTDEEGSGGTPFDLHDDVGTELTSPATSDRLVASDESASGDPNRWLSLSRLTTYLNGMLSLAASRVTSGVLALARIPNLPAGRITSGVLALARIPDLPASRIVSGILVLARIPNLPASRINSGRFTSSRLPTPLDADTVDGLSLWTGTEAEYDAITNPNANTIYVQTP